MVDRQKSKDKKVKPLTESQLEIVRFLGRGCEIYNNWRGKWYLTPLEKHDGSVEKAQTGHTNEVMYNDHEGTHLYRPTVHFFMEQKIIIPIKGKRSFGEPVYKLNQDHPDYADDIKMAMVEGALGVTRKMTKKEDKEK